MNEKRAKTNQFLYTHMKQKTPQDVFKEKSHKQLREIFCYDEEKTNKKINNSLSFSDI